MTHPVHEAQAAVLIGRFQIFHNGQLALLRRALAAAPVCVVVLGSAFQARSPRNPFSWQERAEMIRLALPVKERARLRFVPVRDCYDSGQWVRLVRQGVAQHAGGGAVLLVGHFQDATSEYLHHFEGWTLDDAGRQGDISASDLRAAYFGAAKGGSIDAALSALVDQAPVGTLQFLRAWAALPCYRTVALEWRLLREERALWAGAPYTPVFVTVDAVVQCGAQVLLIRRGRPPGQGLLALPGGFLEPRETVLQSALRELDEETGLRLWPHDMQHALRTVRVFDPPDRSQRGRVITHAHHFDLGSRRLPELRAGDDASACQWVPIDTLGALEDQFHDDHFHILDFFFGLTSS